ncbi:Uncharacterised protein [Sebaldella termitidis]|jgi:hypothetical protein|uniref:Uncharacterized protein n=1 Tax=Sebaldella termitidis (strain ATCC 33386 / NCTC 11300) TaxID=526218 RepID=D1AKG5_SEBTE|nr:hypothetical protein [Sebaldella termitidis]ACZ09081.1 hypothetical protein Sterm_2227 [Sebaldella termitidis ATCC 33386]SUI24399.1 Uncharacterised protein [Sebaldella termitidis]
MLLEINDKKGLRIVPTENIMLVTENIENKNIILLLLNGYEVKLKYDDIEELKKDFKNIKINWYKDYVSLKNKDFFMD